MARRLTKDLCKCGHDHISFIGDNLDFSPDGIAHYEKMDECENCKCEEFSKMKKKVVAK